MDKLEEERKINQFKQFLISFQSNNNTKTLNVNKILRAFVTKPNKEIEAIFMMTLNEVDKDGDGTINYQEFEELMKSEKFRATFNLD